jgi:2-dehydropantoate 2-reductase
MDGDSGGGRVGVKVGIVGGGAMGVAFARFLRVAGADVRLLTSTPAAAAMLRAGVEVVDGGTAVVECFEASSEPGSQADRVIVLVFVKAYDTGTAAAALAPVLARGAAVVSLQNGLGNADVLRAALPESPIAYGSTAIGAHRPAPGRVVLAGRGVTEVGGDPRAAGLVAALLRRAGLPVEVVDDPDRTVWEKAIVSAAINPIAAIAGVPNGAILASGELRSLQEIVTAEACAVARARGVPADTPRMVERARETCRVTATNLCSTLQDLRAGKRTEIDAFTGRIVAYGREAGLTVAANEALLLLVQSRCQAQRS